MEGKLPDGDYGVYYRKSRADLEAELRGEEDTYAKHERIIFDLSKRLGVNIKEVYREKAGTSGERIAERPEMLRLLGDVEDGKWTGIFSVEVERLARGDTMDQGIVAQTFKYSDTLIVTPMRTFDPKSPADEEYFEFNLFMARREFKTTTRRLQDGRKGSAQEGKFPGNRAPYGYSRYKLPDKKGFSLQPHPDQAPIVQLIFSLYTDPDPERQMGTSRIADYLNDRKIPTQRNATWTTATVNGIIRNPVYTSKIRWGYRPVVKRRDGKSRPIKNTGTFAGLHEALIDVETFQRAQEIMTGNYHVPAPKGKISNPLAGLVRCGYCGGAIVLRPYTDKTPSTLMCATSRCKNVSSYFHIVEERLLQALQQWLNAYREHWENEMDSGRDNTAQILKSLQEAAKGAQKRRDELKVQLSNLDDLLEQKVYTIEKYMERSGSITARLKEAETALQKLETELTTEEKRNEAKITTIPRLEHVLKIYPEIDDPAQKNNLLKDVLENIVYTKEKGGRWNGLQDQFTLKLQPRIPR